MAASIDGRFDQLIGLVQGLHGNRGVVFGSPPMGLMVMPPPRPGVIDPHTGHMFPYPYKLPRGPDMIPGHRSTVLRVPRVKVGFRLVGRWGKDN
jgi:hypothetical protein